MSRTVTIQAKHDLPIDAVKERITSRFATIKTSYIDKIGTADMRWEGNIAHVDAKALGQKAKAEVTVTDKNIKIEVHLPWLLQSMSGTIETILNNNADALKK